MTVNIDELKGYLKIDKYALDDEIVSQPSLFDKIGGAWADAVSDRDILKEELATIDAKLDGEIRAQFGDDKFTEGQVKSKIQVSSKHAVAMDAWLDAKAKADQLSVLKEAFEQRNHMLRKLVDLHTSNYFEATSVRSTPNQDRLVYEHRRAKLAQSKEARHAKERA